jgi:hypothetical protein
MDVITQRRCLSGLAGCLLLGAIGAGAWSLSGLPQPQASTGTNVKIGISPQLDDSTAGDQGSDPGLLAISLRSPLDDPPPVPPRRQPPPQVVPTKKPIATPQLNFTLLATIIDSQRSLAIIADPSSAFDIKGVGESLALSPEGVSIVRIESDQVTLKHDGKESTINVDKTKKGGGRANRNNRGRN